MPSPTVPRVHLRRPNHQDTLCGRVSANITDEISLATCRQCRELHRQHATGRPGKRGPMWPKSKDEG